jgi:glycine/D-amino acid oxidase-like deaminating enzyme
MDATAVRWPNSLWVGETPPGADLPELKGGHTADVAVIGGGFTGLSTALHLREAGVDVAIVEAMEPGWGASGRNNGQVIPTLSRPDPDDIVARHGAAGKRFEITRIPAESRGRQGCAGVKWIDRIPSPEYTAFKSTLCMIGESTHGEDRGGRFAHRAGLVLVTRESDHATETSV